VAERRGWIEPGICGLSVRRQCELLGLHRSNVYYEPVPESADELRLMRLIDEEYLRRPHLGSRGMVSHLARRGVLVNRKKMQRLLRTMGLQGLAPRPSTTQRAAGHKVYPYLLRGVEIVRPNQVWACDITYVPMQRGYLYLTAVMDWFSRCVLAWKRWTGRCDMDGRRSSTPIREHNSPASNSRSGWSGNRSPSAWMAKAEPSTT
jgi:putative transposase